MTFNEARDLILAPFQTAWGSEGPVQWDDVAAAPTDGNWARATIKHSDGGAESLADESGTKRFERIGTLYVQIFTPVGLGMVTGYDLAQRVVNQYQSTRSNVWFRRVRMREGAKDGAFRQTTVLVDFSYDDVR